MLLRYYQANSGAKGGNKKNNNRQYWRSPINGFGQQCLDSAANWSAAEDG
jgi:hypothetical protein